METLQINMKLLRGVAEAASNEETRYYLCGVSIEATAGRISYIATDGHMLLAASEMRNTEDNPAIGNWIIPAEICKVWKPAKKAIPHDTLQLHDDGKMTFVILGRTFTPIDGTFPDWRQLVKNFTPWNAENDGIPKFNPALLMRIAKASSIMEGSDITNLTYQSNEKAAVATFGVLDAFGLVMPYRNSEPVEFVLPNWVNDTASAAPPASEPITQIEEAA